MTPEEHASIRNRWLSIKYEYGIDKIYVLKWVLGVVAISSLIIGFVLFWNKRLKSEVILRNKAEKEIKRQRDMFELVINSVPIRIFWKDLKLVYLGCNIHFAKDSGVEKPEYVIGRDDYDLAWKEDADVYRAHDRQVIGTGKPKLQYEETFFNKDGEKIVWLTNKIPLKNTEGKVIGVLAASENITERKLAEVALRESEEKFRKYFENSPFGIIINKLIKDAQGKPVDFIHLDANPSTRVQLGMNLSDLVGTKATEIADEETAEKFIHKYGEVVKTGTPCGFEYYFSHHDRTLWVTAFHLTGDLFVTTFTDITDRKQAQAERDELQAKLLQSQKMESVGQLAGGIAHDFNNILFPIMVCTQLSQGELPDDHPVQENLADILDGTKRAADLVKRILLFSRQKEQKVEPTTLQPIISESYKLLRASLPTNIDVTLDLYDGDDCILCNVSEIHEIILNLCTNAYHAIVEDHGSIVVSLKKQSPPSKLNLSPGAYLCLSVEDNGIGIPETIRDKILEPYITTKDVGKGSGLGLAVVYGIVKSYNGNINIESVVEKGTTFSIFLPITEQEKINAATIVENKDLLLKGKEHILFVDDEESIVKFGKRAFEKSGYTVTSKTDSREALELFKSHSEIFDIVITDMSMPGMVGSELSRKILEIKPDMPIIICSGYNERLEQIKEEKLKISSFLDKPLTIENLLTAVKEVLDKQKINET